MAAVVARHQRALLRVARQASLCHDDALDAYQRALEIFVRRVETVDPATELAWLKVVVRHEAMAIRRARSESVAGEEVDLDALVRGAERPVEDRIASAERVRRSAEALRALKPDEAQALMMKAHGLSYEEICRRNNWSYTKTNRAITEGRRRFMRVYEGIQSGAECERFAGIVEALAEGSASSSQVVEIRPHLRHCTACRAAVRDLHLSRLRRASLLSPAFAVFGQIKQHLSATYYRVLDPTPLAGVRPGAAAAAIAGCLAVGGGTTYCVERGVDPVAALTAVVAPAREEPPPERSSRKAARTPSPTPTPTVELFASTPQPTPEPKPEPTPRPTPQPTAPPSPAPTPQATPAPPPIAQEEYEPVSPVGGAGSAGAAGDATSASPSPSTSRKPAPAPPGGPGEFGGP